MAHELFRQLHRSTDDAREVMANMVYANLDGGGSGLDAQVASGLRKAAFIWAEDTTLAAGRSANAGTMESVAKELAMTSARIVTDSTGCASGARWCMHDALITTKPHDPNHYDLASDYTDFVGRPVQTGWVDVVADSLVTRP